MPPKNGKSLEIGGKVRTLRFRARAWEAFEKATGRNVLNGNALEGLGLPEIITLVWCGLLHEDPDLTRDELGDMLGFRELVSLPVVVLAAIQEDLPEPKPGPEKKRTRRPVKKSASP